MAAAAATAVVVSPAMCDAALEAGYFSGYAALPFLQLTALGLKQPPTSGSPAEPPRAVLA